MNSDKDDRWERAEAMERNQDRMDDLRERLTAIRARITRLTVAAGLPREAWSELCLIDSEMGKVLSDV